MSTDATKAALGPCPAGDPGAIRALAGDLRRIAGTLAGATTPNIAGWRGPAATSAHGLLSSAAGEAGRTAGDLRGCADSLDHAADTLETDQRVWKAAVRRADEDSP